MSERGNPLVQHWRLAALGAVAALFLYSGARVARRPGPPAEPRRALGAPAELMPPPSRRPVAAEQQAAGPDSVEDPLSFESFVRILDERAKAPWAAPMAKAFAKRFMAEPALKRTYEGFRSASAQGKKPTAAAFMAALRKQAAFRKLTGEFGKQAGAAGVLQAFVRQPDLKRFAQEESFALAGPPAAQRSAPPGGQMPQAPPATSSPGAKPALAAEAAPSGATAGGGKPEDGGRREPGGSAPSTPSQAAAKPKEAGARGSGSSPDPKGAAGPRPSARLPAELDGVVGDNPWLALMTPQERASILQWGELGLWGACFRLGLYRRCSAACAASLRGCRAKTAWDSCLDAFGSEVRCVAECSTRGCSAPPDVLARVCVKDPRPAYCPDPQAASPSSPTTTAAPCQASDAVAADCSTWDDADAATKAAFLSYWKDSQGYDEEWVKRRWVWERTKDVTDPGWRDREYGPGWDQPAPGQGGPARGDSAGWPCRPTAYVTVDCKTFDDAPREDQEAFLAYWGGQGLAPEEVRKRWVWEYNRDRTEPGWRDR